ncbi:MULTISPECIES: biotin/lipoyl-binding carrier protein [unclassified Nocardioides]|uniref:biotin/lipoyl-binding carrier protein n=1 Tax=unclassified Nocardioides TaxID=2615069 RepID=UPI0006FDDC2B|nr:MULTISPECIES: biotin/lipoyl-binding carrier protein [unclassified Nocardioides]KQY63495.1 acetyl-CoA carboxylase [Nocardioides sp. Root140]KRF17553.1 acetyl-CoA carboxylase [Nocardioides sp. Soil796]
MSKQQEVRAELAGNVYKILVSVGDEVNKGDQLIVLESMKMEIPVIAPKAGTVTAVNTSADSVIAEGDVLVVMEVPTD